MNYMQGDLLEAADADTYESSDIVTYVCYLKSKAKHLAQKEGGSYVEYNFVRDLTPDICYRGKDYAIKFTEVHPSSGEVCLMLVPI